MMKNKFIPMICVLLLFIPTIAAIFVYNPSSESLVNDPDRITSCEVVDDIGNVFSDLAREDIELIASLLRGEQTDQVPDQVLEYNTLRVTLRAGDQYDTYSVYADGEHPDALYYKTKQGKFYKGDSAHIKEFLSEPYCVSLYDVDVPVLNIGGLPLTPSKMEWKYKQADGTYATYETQTTQDVPDVGRTEQNLGLKFTREPDTAYITVYDDGEAQPTRLLSEFVGVKTSEEKRFTVVIKAEWSTGNASVGSAEYAFSATVKADAVFNIWTTSSEYTDRLFTEQGGVIVLGTKNADVSKLNCEISPQPMTEGYTPVFYADGEYAYAIIPTMYDTMVGDYEISVKYGAEVHTFNVEVTAKDTASKHYSTKKSTAEELFSDTNLAALEKLISDTVSLPTAETYLGTSEFEMPADVSTHRTGYGIDMYIDSIDKQFNHCGIDVKAEKGDDIYAVTDGVVAYVGTDPILGGIVVLDHGLDIKSWYCRVSVDGVEVGTQYEQGDKITEADESGFGDDERAHLSVTVADKFVSPLWLIENGFSLPKT